MPKRSTGCTTCRLRKVKCDEQRPFCQRCIQYNVPCPGYATDKSGETASFQFKDQTVRVAHRAETIYTAKARKHDAVRNDSKSPSSSLSSFSSDDETAMIVAKTLPAFNTAPEMQVQLLSSFIHHYLPREKELPSWFTFVAELPSSHSSNKLISTATNALCLSHHGAVYDDQKLVMEGNKAYLKSIELLAKALPRATGRESDNILAVVGALGICELFRGTLANGSGWQSHVAGSCQLIIARGPDSFDTPVMRQHFDNVRYAALVGGIVGRRPLFFAEPKWMRVTATAPDATPAMALMDLAVQIPGLLVDSDALDVNNLAGAQQVLSAGEALISQLRQWYARHHEADPSTGIETVDVDTMKQFVKVVPAPVFPKVFKYPSFNVASKHAHYWFYLFIIRQNQLELRARYPTLLGQNSPTPSEAIREINIYVSNICKSIPFLFESRSGSIGKISMFMSMDFCRGWLFSQGQWEQLAWLGDVKHAIRNLGFCVPYVTPAENRIGPTFFDDVEEALKDPELQLLTADG